MMPSSKLSHRAELFRSKLIEDFQLLDNMDEQKRRRAPVYSSSDVLDAKLMESLLIRNPDQVIKFKVYKREREDEIMTDIRMTRIRNRNKLPLGVWAHWVVEHENFQKCIIALLIINCVCIGVQGELPETTSIGLSVLKEGLEFINMLTVITFAAEIVLKWIDDFKQFWISGWNIFDLLVTVISAVPHLMTPFINDESSNTAAIAKKLSVFSILQSLRMVSKIGGLRIIVLTILQAFKSMLFITALLSIVAYIFAIVGVFFFETYSSSERDDLVFKKSFNSLPNALITLFQLFTLDQWYAVYKDIIKVSNPALTTIYILLWIWVGSFVFRNLIVGVMVNNFQNISAAITKKQKDEDQSIELARMKEELHMELIKNDEKRKHMVPHEDDEDLEAEIEQVSDGWDHTVRSHLIALASDPGETLWSRDTLFKYLQLLEQLQVNVEEYEKLQKLSIRSVLNIHGADEDLEDNGSDKNTNEQEEDRQEQISNHEDIIDIK